MERCFRWKQEDKEAEHAKGVNDTHTTGQIFDTYDMEEVAERILNPSDSHTHPTH